MVAVKWKWWIEHLQNYFYIIRETESHKRNSIMLQVGGPEVKDIIERFPGEHREDEFEAAVTAKSKQFGPLPDPKLAYKRLKEAHQRDN